MNAAGRLGLYGAGLVVAFGAAFAVASAVVPGGPEERTDMTAHEHAETPEAPSHAHDTGHDNDEHGGEAAVTEALAGLSLSAQGYELSPVTAPAATGETGALSFRILDADGEPVTAFDTAHEKELHLIVVRTDGTGFRHVHPTLDRETGVWSIPWEWDAAGAYRIFADIAPTGGAAVTLTRTVDVAGELDPQPAIETTTVDDVAGYRVSLDGTLAAGEARELTLTVARDGEPVTTLQPYLGALGHLVALRDGDLAYLHAHSQESDATGPDIAFTVEAPTAGRYLLYLDFQVEGEVHTASFVVDATLSGATVDGATGDAPSGHDDGSHEH